MITPRTALARILKSVNVLAEESVPLAEAVGRVLTTDLRACADLPGFDNSAMDGYAIRAADCSLGISRPLKVVAIARAGLRSRFRVARGSAVKIMTGAPLPPGADAVVMKEFTVPAPDGTIRILRVPRRGDHIRPRGEDVRRGARLLRKGVRLRPYEIALLAAQGVARVQVVRRPRVAILATGDELVSASCRLAAGKIRNSNGPASAAALSRWGARVVLSRVVRDDPAALRRALRAALSRADLLLVTGGVSVGDFDHTQAVLRSIGARTVFWQVGMKPGKPLLLGLYRGKPIFGLPGNPVAVMVCLEEFVRPALETLQGHAPGHPSYHLAGTADNAYPKPGDRQQYLFCRARQSADGYRLAIIRPQGSAMLAMACSANALAVAPIGVRRVMPGDRLAFRWLK
jgi:molybdopterin molybdotransferase